VSHPPLNLKPNGSIHIVAKKTPTQWHMLQTTNSCSCSSVEVIETRVSLKWLNMLNNHNHALVGLWWMRWFLAISTN
jgi:hypothetical protein